MSGNASKTPGRFGGRVIGITIAAALGGFLFGFDTSVINGAVEALAGAFDLGAALKGFAVSSALLGCAAGAWFAGSLAKWLGPDSGDDHRRHPLLRLVNRIWPRLRRR